MATDKPKIYTIATAHLDTSWLWSLEQTISEYIPDTIDRNFEFFEKFPEYRFNFEGSYRYELIKEYYPEKFEKIKKYVSEGRWNPCGACYENGDVNIPSPEALTRNILYGNSFFRNEFGTESNDIFLPDCFGFGKALPTVAAHSGLKGFSTGKLFWGSSVPIPFDTGRWVGVDGSGVWAALMPFSYTTAFKDMSKAKRINEKLEKNIKDGLPGFTFAYHGIGDRGGAPHASSVKSVIKAQRSNNSNSTQVVSATSQEYFEMLEKLPDETKNSMKVYDGEFLLTAHGAGSYTSRTVTKRWNRRSELLADAAERFCSAAFVNGVADYPSDGLDKAWKNVIAHHFHDDITGTSFESCYTRSHNDYIQAMNTFSAEYTAACKALSEKLDTSFVTGIPVVVSNPLQTAQSRKEAVSVTLDCDGNFFSVFDKDGNEVPSQVKEISENKKEITFIADVKSCALAVYDIRKSDSVCMINTDLSTDGHSIENRYISVRIDANGDISGIFDKTINKELLKKPVRLVLLNDTHSFDWPAWEIKYEDVCEKPYTYAASPEIRIRDNGCALCALEITQTAGKSTFRQIVSLDSESRFVSVYNETDWREEATLLKAEFSLNVKNEDASYDTGIGFTKRKANTKSLYEVPAQKWADITDESGEYGVAVFCDSRQGWDKPDDSTLRLTLIHTPLANYRWECSQHVMDMGLNRYSYAIMGHKAEPTDITAFADRFCQPMHTFVTDRHQGETGREYSFLKLNNDNIRITAVKKAQESDRIIIRMAECSGKDIDNAELTFALPVEEAYEVSGDEKILCPASASGSSIFFSIKHNSIRSFAVVLKRDSYISDDKTVELKFNATGITTDADYGKSTLKDGISLPREILPAELSFAGVRYEFSQAEKNCIVCDGSEINLPEGCRRLHLILTSLGGDKTVRFSHGDNITEVCVPDCHEHLGHWDMMQQQKTGYIKPVPQAFTLTHTHGRNGNLIAKQLYLFHAEIPVGDSKTVTLPDDKDIVIFAATATENETVFAKGDIHSDTLAKREFDYEFSDYAKRLMSPNKAEKFLDRFFDRTFTINVKAGEFYNKYALNEAYHILRNLNNKRNYQNNVNLITGNRKNNP